TATSTSTASRSRRRSSTPDSPRTIVRGRVPDCSHLRDNPVSFCSSAEKDRRNRPPGGTIPPTDATEPPHVLPPDGTLEGRAKAAVAGPAGQQRRRAARPVRSFA